MPSEAIKLLMKTDRRKQWKGLKEKHAKAISKSKLDFDLKLGPALDKYQSQVDKLTKVAADVELTAVQVHPVFEAVQPLKKIVEAYHTMVKALEDPAKKEMAALLTAIDNDIKSWEELTVNTMGTIAQGTTDAQKAAARAVINELDQIRSTCLMIVTRGPRAKVAYDKQVPNPRPKAGALISQMVETARLAGSASYELANAAQQVVAGSNYELFKARAKAAEPLIQHVKDAADAFNGKWNINLDDMTVSADVDAVTLHNNHDQMTQYFDLALAGLRKLP